MIIHPNIIFVGQRDDLFTYTSRCLSHPSGCVAIVRVAITSKAMVQVGCTHLSSLLTPPQYVNYFIIILGCPIRIVEVSKINRSLSCCVPTSVDTKRRRNATHCLALYCELAFSVSGRICTMVVSF